MSNSPSSSDSSPSSATFPEAASYPEIVLAPKMRALNPDIRIRHMVEGDLASYEALCAESFGPGRYSRAAFRVREQIPADPGLCFVAEMHGQLIGGVLMTAINVGGVNGYLLGPLVTAGFARNQGAGRNLVAAACDTVFSSQCQFVNEDRFVLLVGDASYYRPLGFLPVQRNAIRFPGAVDPDRVLVHCRKEGLELALAGAITKAS